VIKKLRQALVVILCCAIAAAQAAPVLSIVPGSYTLISQKEKKGELELQLAVSITNSGDQTAEGVEATATSNDPLVSLKDDRLKAGTVGAGTTVTPKDTITVVIPVGTQFSESTLDWTFTYKSVNTNIPPTADAGNDATVFVDQLVMLDGSGSADPEGDRLKYEWQFISVPAGSAAKFSKINDVTTTFVPDIVGEYVIQLIVDDGTSIGTPDVVVSTTINTIPVANAGPDQNVLQGDTVQLDGSASSDADGDPLAFVWTLIAAPAGSTATLSDPSIFNPTFVADLAGQYVVQLEVSDGNSLSPPDLVTIVTDPINTRPIANAGPDLAGFVSELVVLDGNGSSDADGDPLTFSWSLISAPAGSAAVINNATSAIANFVPDAAGQYVAQLIVSDGTEDSLPDTALVTIEVGNTPPVAVTGPDQELPAGSTVTLDGSASFDPDGDGLIFIWSLTTVPNGSAAALSNPGIIQPTFLADIRGTYIAQLIVNDGQINSDPVTTTITALNRPPVAVAGADS
jgi:hypothetical protein